MPRAIAPVKAADERPNLEIESEARRGCRPDLVGMNCRHRGVIKWIRGSEWSADGDLTLYLDSDRVATPASEVVLIGEWPDRCCRSKLTRFGLPKPRRARRAR